MVVVDGQGVPLGDYLHSASPAEVKLVEKTLAAIRVRRRHRPGRPRQKPQRMIMDRGYDSDGLRAKQLRCKSIRKRQMRVVSASGFEPPTSWSRTVRQIH
jgi:hypothetical protein